MIDLSKIEYKHFNSHDVEDVALCDFLRFFQNRIGSVLDVGAHDSVRHYCREAKRIVNGRYEAIDILPDPDTALLVDKYHVGNFKHFSFGDEGFDAIISVSSIEHSGLTTYKADHGDHHRERDEMLTHMFWWARKFVFVTFPFGQEGMVSGQYANITDEALLDFESSARSRQFAPLACDFYFSEHPQNKKPWTWISREEAAMVPLNPAIEVQCIGVCSWMKV